MKAVTIARFGGPEVLELTDVETPTVRSGDALVQLEYAGINFIDVYMRSGQYARSHTYQTPLPMTIGMEGGGTIAALGDGVTGLSIGDRVAYCIVRAATRNTPPFPPRSSCRFLRTCRCQSPPR